MAESYHISLRKDYLVFSAGHFITFEGDICERLHGHNYKVQAEVHGELDDNQYVIDFIVLRDELKHICDQLDHHMLLPTEHPTIRVVESDTEVEATFENRRWVFPRNDCVLLPVANTTAELLARYIGRLLLVALEDRTGIRPHLVRIEVDECEGQVAICELRDE